MLERAFGLVLAARAYNPASIVVVKTSMAR